MSDPFDADSTSAMLFCISPRKKIADIVLWMREKNVAEESKIVPAIDIEYLRFFFFFFFVYKDFIISFQLLSFYRVSQRNEKFIHNTNSFILFNTNFFIIKWDFVYL